MPIDYTALVGPMYFLFIGIEIWVSRRHNTGVYRQNDSINDMSTGMLMQLGLLLGGPFECHRWTLKSATITQ